MSDNGKSCLATLEAHDETITRLALPHFTPLPELVPWRERFFALCGYAEHGPVYRELRAVVIAVEVTG